MNGKTLYSIISNFTPRSIARFQAGPLSSTVSIKGDVMGAGLSRLLSFVALPLCLFCFSIITTPAFAQYNQRPELQQYYRSFNNVAINQFRPGSPTYYVVQPGDTYYSIAQRFLTDPSQWAQAWELPAGMFASANGNLVPGSIVVLSNQHNAKLRWFPQGESAIAKRYGNFYGIRTGYKNIKLLPVAWGIGNDKPQVFHPNFIEPFVVQALVVPYPDLTNAPIVAGFTDSRRLGYPGADVYVRGKIDENIREWYVYRPAEELIDPETYASLGYVSRLQGIVEPIRRAPDAYTFKVIAGNMEFERGARLVPVKKDVAYQEYNYQRPSANINARIVGIYEGSQLSHQFRTVIINRGAAAGVKRGDIYIIYRYSPVVYQGEVPMNNVAMPGYGRIYIYRVGERTSFGLIIEGEGEVALYDFVRPDVEITPNILSADGEAINPNHNNYNNQQQTNMRLVPQAYSTPIYQQAPAYAQYPISR